MVMLIWETLTFDLFRGNQNSANFRLNIKTATKKQSHILGNTLVHFGYKLDQKIDTFIKYFNAFYVIPKTCDQPQ